MREKHRARAIRAESPTPSTPRRRLVMLAAPLLLAGHPPHVGNAAEPPATGVTDTSRVGLETIVVTAQRRSEDPQDVELAVAVFAGEALLDAGVTDAMQLQTVVPSLTYLATGYMARSEER